MPTVRSFLAIHISPTKRIRRVLSELQEMGKAVRATRPEGLHLTLKFFGDIDINDIVPITDTVAAIAKETPAFELQLRSLGAFTHLGRPAVIWAGVSKAQALIELANRISAELVPLGFPQEKRSFKPHLTLARVKNRPPESLATLVESNSETVFADCYIESVELFQSDLKPSGPRYTVLSTIPLA